MKRRGAVWWFRLPLIMGLLIALAGCSFTNLAYNHLDLLTRYYLNDYVDLTPEQRGDFDRRFRSVWDWHRATQMPRYAAMAHAIADQVLEVQTPEQVRASLDTIDDFGPPTVRKILEEAAPVLEQLSDAQVAHLLERIDEKIEREFKHAGRGTDAEWHQREFRESRSTFEKYAGDLTPDQEARIREYTDSAVRDPILYHRAAVAARDRFAQILALRTTTDFPSKLNGLIDPHSADSAAIDHMHDASRTRFIALLADLSMTYSAEQRHHFHERVESLAQDLDALANQGKTS